VARLKNQYENIIRPELMKERGYRNLHQVPTLKKVVVNMGLGKAVHDRKLLDSASLELAAITGQKPVVTRAQQSIAGFKVREGMEIGLKVTLRRARMYEFIDRLVVIAMPRMKDFRGLSLKSFDRRGNFSMGIKEHYIFPEIDYDRVDHLLGMDVTIVTTAHTDEDAQFLLRKFGFPFLGDA